MKKLNINWKKVTRVFVVIAVVIVLVAVALGYGIAEFLEFIADLW